MVRCDYENTTNIHWSASQARKPFFHLPTEDLKILLSFYKEPNSYTCHWTQYLSVLGLFSTLSLCTCWQQVQPLAPSSVHTSWCSLLHSFMQHRSRSVRFLHSCAFAGSDHRSGLKYEGGDICACSVWFVPLSFSTSLFQAYKTTGKQLSHALSFAMNYLLSTCHCM